MPQCERPDFGVDVTRTYVQMLHPADLRPAGGSPDVVVERAEPCPPGLYRFLYGEVGRRYRWVDRLPWSDTEITAHLAQPGISIWTLRQDSTIGGFFELVRHQDDSVEIAYFGLLDAFLGRGLGKYLLTEAVTRAWQPGTRRVWLHTCTLDHPAALPNYLARGFRAYKTETYSVDG